MTIQYAGKKPGTDSALQQMLFSTLSKKALSLKDRDRIGDAAVLFQRAILILDADREEKIRMQYYLGICYYLMGDFPRALLQFSIICKKEKKRHRILTYSYLSFVYQIIIFGWVNEFTQNRAGFHRQLKLIDQGLSWLHESGRETWKAPLLTEKAVTSGRMGNMCEARYLAQESLYIAQNPESVSWPVGYHAMILSRFARHAGDFEFCRCILDDVLFKSIGRYTKIQVQTELLRVLFCIFPEISQEMVALARNMEDGLYDISSNRTKVEALAEITQIFARTKDYDRAMRGLSGIRAIVAHDTFFHCRYLQDTALDCFRACLEILSDTSHVDGRNITNRLPSWIHELERRHEGQNNVRKRL